LWDYIPEINILLYYFLTYHSIMNTKIIAIAALAANLVLGAKLLDFPGQLPSAITDHSNTVVNDIYS